MPRSLDLVVTSVATQLMEATESTASQVCQRVLGQLVAQFDLDAGFLCHHDHDNRAAILVAEWPPRTDIPDPDPMAVRSVSADQVLARCEHARKPVVIRSEDNKRSFPRWMSRSRKGTSHTVGAAPLVSGETTTGVLGFVKNGARKWKQDELNTLEAVAALFAQLQARIAAEAKLRYLAEHDDLTGLHNRRALIAHLSVRLAPDSPGPVAVLLLDLDRLKPINDHLGHAAGDWFIRVFAQRIRVCGGNQSMVARVGGDEFVVIPDQPMSAETAESFAGGLGAMLRERLTIGGHIITRTVSIGLTVGVPGRDNCADLLHRADAAVLSAKRGGGNQVALFTEDMSLKSAFSHDIALQLQGDVNSEAVHYLPQATDWPAVTNNGGEKSAETTHLRQPPLW